MPSLCLLLVRCAQNYLQQPGLVMVSRKACNSLGIIFPESGHIKEVIVAGGHVFENPNGHLGCDVGEEQDSPGDPEEGAAVELIKVKLLVNKEGRYVCELCHKTFKTVRWKCASGPVPHSWENDVVG